MRDAISLLDQAKASFPGHIERDDVLGLAGIVQDEFMQQMAEALVRGEAAALLELIDQLVMAGRDLARFVTDLAQHLRNILICQVSANPHLLVRAASDTLSGMQQLAGQVSSDQLIDLIKGLSALLTDLRWAADGRTALEIGLIRLMAARTEIPVTEKPIVITAPKPEVKAPAMPVKTEQISQTAQGIKKSDPGPVPPPTDDDIIGLNPPMEESIDEESLEVEQESPETATVEPAADNGELAPKLWSDILDHLLNEGHMTLYLFCRPVQPKLADKQLRLHFSAADNLNFQEVSTTANIKVLRAAASRLLGSDITIQAILDGHQQKIGKSSTQEVTTDSWIDKMKKTADTLGIPMKVEE
jgi:DNA polymerase III subunit gamma/tau